MSFSTPARRRFQPLDISLRVLVAVGLVVDAVMHLKLASGYQLAAPGGIGQGNLFRIEAVVAILGAVSVLVRGGRLAYALAAVLAISGVVAVVLYRCIDVPAIGPIPSMYEPVWFFQKSLSAVAEGFAGVLAVVCLLLRPRRGQGVRRCRATETARTSSPPSERPAPTQLGAV